MDVLILAGPNHGFDKSAPVIHEFLAGADGLTASLTDDADALASDDLANVDALVFGTGFSRIERLDDGSRRWVRALTNAQEDGLFDYVNGGGGLVGIHGTAWNVGGRCVDLLGGNANWHPPGLTFTVNIGDMAHPITEGVEDFEVDDEIYMTACDPAVATLATAKWQNRNHPMAWTKTYGDGRVFYTTLGHGPSTFERAQMQKLMTQAVRWAGGE